MAEKHDDNRVIIFDTTLRDGEQSPGATMNLEEKILIAETLDRMGVDVIEAGFARASQGDFDAVRAVASRIKSASVCSLARAINEDIEAAYEAIKDAKKPRIHTFISTSSLHMKHKLQMDPNRVLDKIGESVSYAKSFCDDVEWSAEDATRSDKEFLYQAIEIAINAGATTVNLPDTVGYTIPTEYAQLMRDVKANVPNISQAIISVHCHNDLGLAVANSLAAVHEGARQVECTINGLGERAGNAAMEEIIMAFRTRHDAMPYTTDVDATHITRASRLVSTVTGFVVQNNKAIVGANAFAHESGIHQDGMLKHSETYEIMTPESVGLQKSELVLGKHSGRHAFKNKLQELGIELGDNAFEDVFVGFKVLADKKKDVYDEDIIALIDNNAITDKDDLSLTSLSVECGSVSDPHVSLEMNIGGEVKHETSSGSGPVDALFNCVKALVPHNGHLELYQVHAVTGGTDAQAEVTVRLSAGDLTVTGHGRDTDTLVASARAYISAVDRLLKLNEN